MRGERTFVKILDIPNYSIINKKNESAQNARLFWFVFYFFVYLLRIMFLMSATVTLMRGLDLISSLILSRA